VAVFTTEQPGFLGGRHDRRSAARDEFRRQGRGHEAPFGVEHNVNFVLHQALFGTSAG
jgi:hypothetical protein